MSRRTVALVGMLAAALLLPACSGGASGARDKGGDTQVLTVFAAASLKSSFEEIATDFEGDHPGVDVQLSFAGSSDLVTQIDQGAPADVLATADTATMDQAVESDLVSGTPQDFATNTLTIAVPAGNPAGITDLASLAEPGVQLVLCAPQVPCGRAAEKVEESAGVSLSPVSEEQSVTDVLGKVTSGEADAGLVYVTDAASAGDAVEQIGLPEARADVNTYPLAVVAGTSQEELATEFTQEVLGERGQEVLAGQGFQAP